MRILIPLCVIICLAVCVVSFASGSIKRTANKSEVVFEVKSGDTLARVSQRLEKEGIIKDASSFSLFVKLAGKAESLKTGTYEIPAQIDYGKLLGILVRGKGLGITVTIPEGYTIFKIADLLEHKGLVEKRDFLAACRNDDLIKKYAIPAGTSIEGYLYPDTYSIPRGYSALQIVGIFTNRFDAVTSTLRSKLKKGQSFHELVTMASIVEREARVASERPLIAGVYYNRLSIRMRLQADPTLIYALELDGKYYGNIRREHFTYDSPYNTYRYPGLPPGPIANPGLDSLQAALKPKNSSFIYFVARPDGSHKFSETFEEHDRAVDEYQRKR